MQHPGLSPHQIKPFPSSPSSPSVSVLLLGIWEDLRHKNHLGSLDIARLIIYPPFGSQLRGSLHPHANTHVKIKQIPEARHKSYLKF